MDTMINEKSACVNYYIDLPNEIVYFPRREAAALPGGSSGRRSPGKMPPPAVRKVRKEGWSRSASSNSGGSTRRRRRNEARARRASDPAARLPFRESGIFTKPVGDRLNCRPIRQGRQRLSALPIFCSGGAFHAVFCFPGQVHVDRWWRNFNGHIPYW